MIRLRTDSRRRRTVPSALLLLALAAPACQGAERTDTAHEPAPDTALAATLHRATLMADSMDDVLRPVPLLRPSQEEALRQYPNAVHVATARRLGERPGDGAALDRLIEQGRLVPLEDSTAYWVLREMTASRPVITPGTRALLERIGRRFQQRLAELGLPPLRFEISSALRTPADQADLRRENANAAGTSAHEFGTTVDIPYSAFPAPAELPPGIVGPGQGSELEAVARLVLERMAARKSRELQAILGAVLLDAQAGGLVLVTLERQQPVFHITVADGS